MRLDLRMYPRTQEEIDAQTKKDLRDWDHYASWCYADERYSCMSCGCYPPQGRACPSHSGSHRYSNYLKTKEIELQQRLVDATESMAGITYDDKSFDSSGDKAC